MQKLHFQKNIPRNRHEWKRKQSAEGGNIPTDIYGESIGGKTFETLTVKTRKKKEYTPVPGQLTLDIFGTQEETSDVETILTDETPLSTDEVSPKSETSDFLNKNDSVQIEQQKPEIQNQSKVMNSNIQNPIADNSSVVDTNYYQYNSSSEEEEDLFDKESVMKFINDAGLLSYNIRSLKINNYLKSLFEMAHLLTICGLHREAIREVQTEIALMIADYIQKLKLEEKYEELVNLVKEFKLATRIFDAFGETVDNYSVHDLFTSTDTDIDRQFRVAETKLGNEGIGMVYGNNYIDINNPNAFKVDVILFVADDETMSNLHNYAQKRFHGLNDYYRKYIAAVDYDKIRSKNYRIVSDGDVVSKHNFRLPETIQVPHEDGGKEYNNHLFVNHITGIAKLKLNTWEAGVIEEEEKRDDFVCWIRNPSRASWALCIPYEIDNETKPTFPDFIVVRKDDHLGYVIDLLEPHNTDFKDNLGKAKGFAEYARQNPGVGRIQLIRMGKDAAGKNKFKRLDMSKSAIRDKVSHAMTIDELDHIFDTDGFFSWFL